MSAKEKLGLLFYRFAEKGLEVFLVKDKGENWAVPENPFDHAKPVELSLGAEAKLEEDPIELDPIEHPDGLVERVMAMETELEDAAAKFFQIQKSEGTYIAVKEAFKKVMPAQYAMLKELQDILSDRNLTKYL